MLASATACGVLVMLSAAAAPAPQPEDCDAYYNGVGRPKDFDKALACYRAQEDWTMLAIMQLNGEGTPVDLAGARASFRRKTGDKPPQDGDDLALDQIITKREKHPTAPAARVDFCKDIAATTVSINACDAQEEDRKAAKADTHLQQLRARLDPRMRVPFDRVVETFHAFVPAESRRAYQLYIDGSIRNQFATAQEALLRTNFTKTLKALTAAGTPPPLKRSLQDADGELNAFYKADVHGYVSQWEKQAADTPEPELKAQYKGWAADYKREAHSAQHQWILYRDAMAKLAASHWPTAPAAEEVAKALITEDRLRELKNTAGEGN